jgi:hypothetical protein
MVRVDGDPQADGLDLPVGCIAIWNDGGTGKMYMKTGTLDTDWTLSITTPQVKHENLPFIGSGTGASKTTTVRDGPTIAEQMTIGDELFVMFHFPLELDKTKAIQIEVEWYLNATETGKVISGEIDIAFADGMALNIVTDTIIMTDEPVPSPAYFSKQSVFTVDLASYPETETAESLHIVFKRVASSDDPTAHPRLHHISVDWTPLSIADQIS